MTQKQTTESAGLRDSPGPTDCTATQPGRQVLIIDDDRDFLESLALLLERDDYVVRTAGGEIEARQGLQSFAAEVALIDIRLRRGSGLEFLAELRHSYPELVCIMMTAYASVPSATQALQEGAYDYLCKPFMKQDLISALDRGFERVRLSKERAAAIQAVTLRNRELEEINARLHGSVKSLRGLSSCTNIRSLCTVLLADLGGTLAAKGGSIYLLQGGRLGLQGVRDPGHAPDSLQLPLKAGSLFAHAMATKKPVLAADLSREGHLCSSGWTGYSDGSLLVFPLIEPGGDEACCFGVVAVHGKDGGPFTARDRELGQILVSFGCEAVRALSAIEDLARSEEHLRKVIDNSPSAIALKDAEGRYLLVNRRFGEWHGLEAAEAEGRTSGDLFSGPVARAYQELDRQVLSRTEISEQELDVPFADGSTHRLLVTKFPVLDGAGKPAGIGTISTDITDRKRVEEQLRQAQKMEALGQLTGGVAHDFNNHLAVILGNLDLVREETEGDSELQDLLDDALDSARSGAALSAQLLAFGRRQTLHPEITDVGKLVEGMSRLLRRTLGGAIEIDQLLPGGLWTVEVDRAQLGTSLLNLALNARDAMSAEGRLVIETSNLALDHQAATREAALSAGRYVLLSVRDNGMGMEPEVAARALEPFFSTKEVGRGSGLGLSMVYGFVKQSGGHLEIDSRPGAGAAITLYLPAADKPASRHGTEAVPSNGNSGRGQRILLVEDEPKVRKLGRRILTRLGYEVLEAGDGAGALAILAKHGDVDLLFTDIVLPGGMNGVELARRARRLGPDLRVLYTSGFAQQSLLEQGMTLEKARLVDKPFRKEQLAEAVQAVLARESG